MLKNKLKALFIMLIILLLAFSPFVFAEDEDTTMPEVTSEENGVTVEESTEDTNDEEDDFNTDQYLNNMKEEDVYLVGDEITIDYIIDGNLFVIANKVNISSQVVGNAFICANDVNVSSQGYVSNSLFVAASNLTLDGVAYDVYATCENIKISGYVYRDLKSMSNELNILGTIGRNASIASKNISFSQALNEVTDNNNDEPYEEIITTVQGQIIGNLNYTSSQEIEIPESSVGGEIKFEQGNFNTYKSFSTYIISLISSLLLVLVIWLLLKWLAPKFIEKTDKLLTTKIGSSIGFGVLSLIAIPVISVALLCISFTRPIALLLLFAYIVLVALSINIFVIALSNIICNKFKISKNLPKVGILLATSLVLWLLSIIPYVGIINIICVILGLGIITKNLVSKK